MVEGQGLGLEGERTVAYDRRQLHRTMIVELRCRPARLGDVVKRRQLDSIDRRKLGMLGDTERLSDSGTERSRKASGSIAAIQ